MTTQELLESGAIGTYRKSTFTQGMATYPCYEIDFNGGYYYTSMWANPNCKKTVLRFIEKHKGKASPILLHDNERITHDNETA